MDKLLLGEGFLVSLKDAVNTSLDFSYYGIC